MHFLMYSVSNQNPLYNATSIGNRRMFVFIVGGMTHSEVCQTSHPEQNCHMVNFLIRMFLNLKQPCNLV
jgi:hypothetical protein